MMLATVKAAARMKRRGDIDRQVSDDDVDFVDLQAREFPDPVADVPSDLLGHLRHRYRPADGEFDRHECL
jgi:hypothetical protein